MKRHWCTYLMLWIGVMGWSSCAEEDLSYPITTVQLPTTLALTDLCFVSPDTGYASAGNLFTEGAMLMTTDRGFTWSLLMPYGTGIHSLAKDGNRFLIGQGGQALHINGSSFSGGGALSQQYYATGWWQWHSMVPLSNGEVLLAGGENFGYGFLHRYSNGNLVLTDTLQHEIRALARTPDGAVHAAGYGTIMRSVDEGHTWEVAPVAGDFFRGVHFPSAEVGYVVGEYGAVYKTTNAGIDWQQVRAGSSVFASTQALLRDVAFVDASEGFLVGTNGTVYRSTNGGSSWKRVKNLALDIDYNAIKIVYGRAYLLGSAGELVMIELE